MPTCLSKYSKFISKFHQVATPTQKPHGLVGQFPNRHKGNKESYDSIDAFIYQLKEDIGEPIEKLYNIEITGIKTIY